MKRLFPVLLFLFPAVQVTGESCSTILGGLFVKKAVDYELFSKNEGGLERVGAGRLLESRPDFLEFQYVVTSGKLRPQGWVRIEHLRACRYRLTVTGIAQNGPESEEVEADPLFIRRNMLHFYFDRRRRFFQIDRRDNDTRMVTEYGPIIFRPVKH
jgi:hypothetical protein